MSLWDSVYNSRVWTSVVALVWWLIGLAVLEAENEASHVAALVLASIAVLLGNWYGAYIWYRLWYKLPELQQVALPMTMGDANTAASSRRSPSSKSSRSLYSVGAWVDCWFALVVVWAMWSQMTYTLWPNTFDTSAFKPSGNHWAAATEWFSSVVSMIYSVGPRFPAEHPVITTIYAFIQIIFKLYDVFIFAIILGVIWTRYNQSEDAGAGSNNNKSHPKKTDELSAPHTSASASSYHHQQHVPFTDAAQLGVYWNTSAPDDLALFLNQQHQQAYAAGGMPMSMNV